MSDPNLNEAVEPDESVEDELDIVEGADEELDEALESEMTLVFVHLAPILQNVPGSHWDLIFDVMENNLEVGSHP